MLLAQYFAQFLVLGFTVYVWWAARRDLALRAAQMSGPALDEWERLQQAVQTVIADLERRATEAERRVAAAEQRIRDAETRLGGFAAPAGERGPAPEPLAKGSQVVEAPLYAPTLEQAAHEERYAPVHALADAGVTDVAEIVRRTGLGHGEVALVLGLRSRQAPR